MWLASYPWMRTIIRVEDVSSDSRLTVIKGPGMTSASRNSEFEFSLFHFVLGAIKTAYVTRLDYLHWHSWVAGVAMALRILPAVRVKRHGRGLVLDSEFMDLLDATEKGFLIARLGEAMGYIVLAGQYGCGPGTHFRCFIRDPHALGVGLSTAQRVAVATQLRVPSRVPDYVFVKNGRIVLVEFKGHYASKNSAQWRRCMSRALSQVLSAQNAMKNLHIASLGAAYAVVSVFHDDTVPSRDSIVRVCDPGDREYDDGNQLLTRLVIDGILRRNYGLWLCAMGLWRVGLALLHSERLPIEPLQVRTVDVRGDAYSFVELPCGQPPFRCSECFGEPRYRFCFEFPFACLANCLPVHLGLRKRLLTSTLAAIRDGDFRLSFLWNREHEGQPPLEAGDSLREPDEIPVAVVPDGSICAAAEFVQSGTAETLEI